MAVEKKKILQHFEVMPDGVMFLKEQNQFVENGVVVSSIPHRTPFYPGDDVSHVPYESFKNAAANIWTDEVKKKYKDKIKNEK